MSSSAVINSALPTIPERAREYVRELHTDHVRVSEWIERASTLSIAVIGERILDEYVYVEPAGKSPKENLVTFRRTGEIDRYDGGVDVVAAHLRENVPGAVIPAYIRSMPQVVKSRGVQKAFTAKVFSTAEIGNVPELPTDGLDAYDMVVCADFGHGLIPNPAIARRVAEQSKWLALTVQANSLNFGFNVATKWSRADYLCIDRTELRLASHGDDSVEAMKALRDLLGLQVLTVTLGHEGAILLSGSDMVRVPVFTERAVDRIGAGDAFLAFTAPLVKVRAPLRIVGLVGAVAAAIHVSRPGNDPVRRNELMGALKATLA